MSLRIKHLNKSFPGLTLYRDFAIEVREREITSILGPSGCGKTTLLNMISGVVEPDSGELSGFEGKKISYVFQEPRLLPWKTVKDNIELVLKTHLSPQDREQTAKKYIDMVEMTGFTGHYPNQLSGGMKQRVALARAFAYPSDILLMDEPFRALDIKLRGKLIDSFKAVWAQDQRTVIFVTHDVEEALLLGDMIFVLCGVPAGINKTFRVILKEEERNLQNEKLQDLKKKICSAFQDLPDSL